MKLLDVYANACGVKIPKQPPHFPTNFFLLPSSKYITVHAGSGMPSKNYSYWGEALQIVKPFLDKQGIQIVQIGESSEPKIPISGIVDYRGRSRLRQTAFVLENTLLHLSNDTCWAHFCGSAGIPCISLYGPTHSKVCSPYFQEEGKFMVIESSRNGGKPTNSREENPRTIDMIKPEEVSNKILNFFLKAEDSSCGLDSVWIGENYLQTQIEVVPNCLLPNLGDDKVLNIRADYMDEMNLNAIFGLTLTNNCIVYTKEEIPINALGTKTIEIFFLIDENKKISKQYLDSIIKRGLNYTLIYKDGTDEELSKLRFHYFEYKPVAKLTSYSRESLDKKQVWKDQEVSKESYFKSYRHIVSDSKIYLTRYHLENNIPIPRLAENTMQIGDAIDSKAFWENLENIYIFNIKKQ